LGNTLSNYLTKEGKRFEYHHTEKTRRRKRREASR